MSRIRIPRTDFDVFPVGLGAATLGIANDEADAKALLDRFVEHGGNLIDTARVYSDWVPGELHRSERVLGDWLSERKLRDQVLVATKGGHPYPLGSRLSRLSPGQLEEDVNGSLKSLRVERIDLYWLHRDDPALPVGPIMDCLHRFQTEGKIRFYAASNWSPRRIRTANAHAQEYGYDSCLTFRTGCCRNPIRLSRANGPPGDHLRLFFSSRFFRCSPRMRGNFPASIFPGGTAFQPTEASGKIIAVFEAACTRNFSDSAGAGVFTQVFCGTVNATADQVIGRAQFHGTPEFPVECAFGHACLPGKIGHFEGTVKISVEPSKKPGDGGKCRWRPFGFPRFATHEHGNDQGQIRLCDEGASRCIARGLFLQAGNPLFHSTQLFGRKPQPTRDVRIAPASGCRIEQRVVARQPAKFPADAKDHVFADQDVDQVEMGGFRIAMRPATVDHKHVACFHTVAEAAGHMNTAPGEDDDNFKELMAVRRHGWLVQLPINPHAPGALKKDFATEASEHHGGKIKNSGEKFKDDSERIG